MSRTKGRKIFALIASIVVLALLSPAMGADAAGGSADDPVDVAVGHIQDNASEFNVSRADVSDLRVSSSYRSSHNRVTHVNLNQRHDGLEIFGAYATVNVAADGEVLFVGDSLVSEVADGSESVETDAVEAVESAADALDLEDPGNLRVVSESRGAAQRTVLSGGDISDASIPARLGWQPTDDGLDLAWQLVIDDSSDVHLWNATVDAETGELLAVDDWTDNESHEGLTSALARPVASSVASTALASNGPSSPDPVADGSSYRVFEIPKESPLDGPRTLVTNPADATGSRFGWHDTDGAEGPEFTVTRGNNVHAYTDQDANNQPDPGSDPDGGPGLTFDFPLDLTQQPQEYSDAAVTNLFYWCNIAHDVFYRYGFDEASGNFQVTNYTGEGVGGDDVRCEAQDGAGFNNANFSTPAMDGGRPRMQMFLWNVGVGPPNRVTIDAPSSAAGTYLATGANFGPAPDETGISGDVVLVDDGVIGDGDPPGTVTDGCEPFTVPAGSIALIDRGFCPFVQKVNNAQDAGASAVIVANNVGGNPITMGGTDPGIVIPSVMISLADGNTIKDGLPATGRVHSGAEDLDPLRDGDLDAGIVLHEYSHGVSNRLTGGPTINCLTGDERMGEGWSDYHAIATLIDPALDDPDGPRGLAPYALWQDEGRQSAGIRPAPYSRTMEIQPFTYDRIKTNAWITGGSLSIPHGVGHGWASILWDMTWNLIDRHGFNPNVYEPWHTGGNNLAQQLVMDGLKFQGCGPGFVVGRNAIIAADQALTDGENACILWSAFARRGLGLSAVQGTTDRDDNTEAFDVPPSCSAPGTGFSPPVANPPALNTKPAGETVPLRFNIGGDRGPDPLASNSPASQQIDCSTHQPLQFAITTPTESADGRLLYNARQQRYQYNWETLEEWAGTCRRVIITLDDGTQLGANFRFE